MAAELHFSYYGKDSAQRHDVGEPTFQADRFHVDEAGHRENAERDFPALWDAVQKAGLDSLSASDHGKL